MGVYRARDLVRVPGLLSLARLPLAAAFPFVVERPLAAMGVLFAAGVSDVLDGWYARRFGQVTPTGSVVDPVTDKVFVLTVVVTLVVGHYLAPLDVLLLGTREVGELPLVLWLAASHEARSRRAATTAANVPGKVATVLQFGAAAAALLRVTELPWLVDVTAVAGAAAAASYWVREIRAAREAR
jgi:cardiolipin synthase